MRRSMPNQILSEQSTKLPWYMYPVITCKVLNRIAFKVLDPVKCRELMDKYTMLLWSKQERWYSIH